VTKGYLMDKGGALSTPGYRMQGRPKSVRKFDNNKAPITTCSNVKSS
jgi:hypothetical protein